jgi:predicted nuclease of predicted toxin-antitoxin system
MLARRCADRYGIYAASVIHLGLSETSDRAIWQYAFSHDFTVVTTNAKDFFQLLDVELHSGLIVLRESGLTRDEQWARLATAIDHIQSQRDPDTFLINRVIEVYDPNQVHSREVPPPRM